MIVLCPTRGRPERAAEMLASFHATAVLSTTSLVLVIDADDPSDYSGLAADRIAVEGGSFPKAVNEAAADVWGMLWDNTAVLGCIGDDFLFRSPGWDRRVSEALATPGVVYGNDLLMGEALPTAVFMSLVIPRALGWYVLPTLRHLCADDAWKAIGLGLGRLRYLPGVVIEHMHPVAGKAQVDATYERGGMNGEANVHDHAAFDAWAAGPIDADLARVRDALAVAA